ncbi:uncharacterized protein L969DRAFT_96755 [Mixia osmundae IAM 14324]|uniref:Uncharacterized protein n=1 Tax=Mixia osmundae (strain CBS 9802 / IAM 14324 / JCM 22182 / KY 12970) TaxID=764103 RepID=G7DZM3_MIXOS|nr:uncharacterized protein L969DRAFT_96755 [Mixia osmundae IAM 14324]KEI37195.1 hypothetical protein L969DRAFT_96755 [Mixia osmundae IAM 14324]GAA96033.1 hypothetical protein E5Q_02693 [Mixia osmundae IAM 14324]
MKSFTTLISATLLAGYAAAQAIIQTPTSAIFGQPVLLTFSGGSAPYYISVIPGGQPSAAALESFPTQTAAGTYTWTVDLPVGTSCSLEIRDSTGAINYSQKFTILAASGSSGSSSTGAASSSAAAGAAAGTASSRRSSTRTAASATSAAVSTSASAVTSASSAATTAAAATTASAASAASSPSASSTGAASSLKLATSAFGLVALSALAFVF